MKTLKEAGLGLEEVVTMFNLIKFTLDAMHQAEEENRKEMQKMIDEAMEVINNAGDDMSSKLKVAAKAFLDEAPTRFEEKLQSQRKRHNYPVMVKLHTVLAELKFELDNE